MKYMKIWNGKGKGKGKIEENITCKLFIKIFVKGQVGERNDHSLINWTIWALIKTCGRGWR